MVKGGDNNENGETGKGSKTKCTANSTKIVLVKNSNG